MKIKRQIDNNIVKQLGNELMVFKTSYLQATFFLFFAQFVFYTIYDLAANSIVFVLEITISKIKQTLIVGEGGGVKILHTFIFSILYLEAQLFYIQLNLTDLITNGQLFHLNFIKSQNVFNLFSKKIPKIYSFSIRFV